MPLFFDNLSSLFFSVIRIPFAVDLRKTRVYRQCPFTGRAVYLCGQRHGCRQDSFVPTNGDLRIMNIIGVIVQRSVRYLSEEFFLGLSLSRHMGEGRSVQYQPIQCLDILVDHRLLDRPVRGQHGGFFRCMLIGFVGYINTDFRI